MMRKLTLEEFVEHYLEEELELYGLSDEEKGIYYHMYCFGRYSVRS